MTITKAGYDNVDLCCFWICSCEHCKETFLPQYIAGNFLAIWATISCSRRNLFIRVTSLVIGRWLWIHLYSFYNIVNLLEFHLWNILCNDTLNFYHIRKDMHASLLFVTWIGLTCVIACFRGRDYTSQNTWSLSLSLSHTHIHTHTHTHTHTMGRQCHHVADSTWQQVHVHTHRSASSGWVVELTFGISTYLRTQERTNKFVVLRDTQWIFPEVFMNSRATFWENLQLLSLRFFCTFGTENLKTSKELFLIKVFWRKWSRRLWLR